MKDLEERKKNKRVRDQQQQAVQPGASALDVPYPDGVRKRSKIHTYEIKIDELLWDLISFCFGLFVYMFIGT